MLYQLSYFRKLNFVIQKSERLVPRTGLEPACLSTHAPETCASTNSATWAFLRAENETRTRDPNLGKVMLYQLSYFRIIFGLLP